jgi:thymidylate kinase
MNEVQRFLSILFAELNKARVYYCVLRNWTALPERVGNDVDMWVSSEDAVKFENILFAVASRLGWKLVRRTYRLGYRADGHFVLANTRARECLVIDTYRYLTWRGLRYMDEEILYHHTYLHEKGFRVPKPGVEAASLLLKELLFEGMVRKRYWKRIAEFAETDRSGFVQAIQQVLGRKTAKRILERVVSGEWGVIKELRHRLQLELLMRALSNRPLSTIWLCARHFYLRAKERVRPQGGFFLVLIGPDGVGKTTTAKALLRSPLIKRLFSSGVYLYRRFPLFPELKSFLPRILRRKFSLSTNPTVGIGADEPPPAGAGRCILYLLYYGLEYFLGRLWLWKVCRLENRIIVFDRYWLEFIFQKQYKNCPRFLLHILERLAAKPDALDFLDVPPEVAHERKPEKSLAEIRRTYRLCEEVVDKWQNGYRLKVTSVEQSVQRIEAIIVERLVKRTCLKPLGG